MNTLVRAVITGFGLSLGKLIFDKVVERISGTRTQPQPVVVVNASEFQSGADDMESTSA